MSLDQSSYPEHMWDPSMEHDLAECPTPNECDNGHGATAQEDEVTKWRRRALFAEEAVQRGLRLADRWDARFGPYPNGFCRDIPIREATKDLRSALSPQNIEAT